MPRPLVELHVHLEGSLRPARLLELAARHGRPDVTRACLTGDGDDPAYRPCASLGDFLELFKAATSVVRTPADHHALALDLGEDLAAQGVVYAEVTVSYGVLQRREIDPLAVQRALAETAGEVASRHGVRLRWLPDAVRQWGPDPAWRALETAVTAGRDLGVVGFGLGGDEDALPVADFAAHFADARREGLGTTCHAGETGRAAAVREAVEDGDVDRVGHALGAARDDAVMALLAARGVHAELCPGANAATGVVAARADHPLRAFLDAGVSCSLGTDDPAMFGTTLRDEYAGAAAEHGLTDAEADAMVRGAVAASFAAPGLKREIGALVDADPS